MDIVLIERMLQAALNHHSYDAVPKSLPIDAQAYFSALNLLHTALTDRNHKTKNLVGTLTELPAHHEVFSTPIYQKSSDDKNYYVFVAKIILAYRLETKGNVLYFFDNFGGHNKVIHPKKELQNKAGTLILPFNLIATIKKELMPIDVAIALIQNPFHESFNYKLSPSPATSFAVEHDLHRQMGFITHPKLLAEFFTDSNEEQINSLSYDTRLALDLLKSQYSIDVNMDTVNELAQIDEKLQNHKGFACIEIEN